MTTKPESTPSVEPILGSNPTSSSSTSTVPPSSMTAPSSSASPPDRATAPSTAGDRPGTQDALRGQGNSAAKAGDKSELVPQESTVKATLNREDVGPAAREQEAAGREQRRAGDEDFATSKDGGEKGPAVGVPHADRESGANLVEAGTSSAGGSTAAGGSERAARVGGKARL